MKSRLRHCAIDFLRPRTSSSFDRKYDASSIAILPSVCFGVEAAQRVQYVRLLHVAVIRCDVDDSISLVAERIDVDALGFRCARHRQRFDGHDDHVLVEYMSVLDARAHRQGRGLLPAVEEDRGAGDAHQWRLSSRGSRR